MIYYQQFFLLLPLLASPISCNLDTCGIVQADLIQSLLIQRVFDYLNAYNEDAFFVSSFVDDYTLKQLYTRMADLTESCNIRNPRVQIALGSYTDTTASWSSAKKELSNKCDCRAISSLSERLAREEGPLDLCYAYVWTGFQIVELYYNNTLPFDFADKLIAIYEIVYPLNMYWQRSEFMPYEIAFDFLKQVSVYLKTGGSVKSYQAAFCNKYFGQDDLDQFHSHFAFQETFRFQQ